MHVLTITWLISLLFFILFYFFLSKLSSLLFSRHHIPRFRLWPANPGGWPALPNYLVKKWNHHLCWHIPIGGGPPNRWLAKSTWEGIVEVQDVELSHKFGEHWFGLFISLSFGFGFGQSFVSSWVGKDSFSSV